MEPVKKKSKFLSAVKFIFVALIGMTLASGVLGMFTHNSPKEPPVAEQTSVSETTTTETAPAEEKTIDGTVGQLNALGKAKNYLSTAPFSAKGLAKQLDFEGFPKEDITFAIENVGADWNEQAVIASANYLSTAPFSKKGLVKQLEFEGYTSEQASFGVNNITVDWNEEASRAAKNYLEMSSFSRKSLINQLVFEGYTKDQAKYGVDQTGL